MNTDSASQGYRPGRTRPKGRALDLDALAWVTDCIGPAPYPRHMLLEYLHRISDAGGLDADRIGALAHLARLAPAEVFEVATFYARLRWRDQPTLPRSCDGPVCRMAGFAPSDGVEPVPCIGRCAEAPAIEGRAAAIDPPPGDYRVLRSMIDGDLLAEAVTDQVARSGLRGLGGAGFPVARKWSFVAQAPGPRHMVVNADEGEPGTFKDRHLLETAPHEVLEGMLIAARMVGAETCWIYLRDEYDHIRRWLEAELPKLAADGLAPPGGIHLRRGAGAYICGEETALLESLEGKRGLPRQKPPFPAQSGLFGQPTLIHNVETLYWLVTILEEGGDWFAAQGLNGAQGLRYYSVSGRVREPGVKLAPAGITARQLIEDHAGGMADGHRFKAYLPGGASGGILPARLADVPLDFGRLEEHGCFVGSAAVIVLSEADAIAPFVGQLMRFFAHESCGQCTPCRVGTAKAVPLVEQDRWDGALLGDLAGAMADASICGLGQAAANPIRTAIRYFADELGLAEAAR